MSSFKGFLTAIYEIKNMESKWEIVDHKQFQSWTGERRINSQEYHGEVYCSNATQTVWTGPRACPCEICQKDFVPITAEEHLLDAVKDKYLGELFGFQNIGNA